MGRKTETKTAACHGGGGGGSDGPDPYLHLPEEVLIQILVRQPIVSLLRLKSVCKSWRALIQTSFFIHLHTTFNSSSSSSSSNFGSFILRTDNILSENEILMLSECEASEYEGSENGDWYRCTDGSWHKFTTTGGDDDDDQLLLKVDKLELPSCYKLTCSKVIAGSCNGLICQRDTERMDISLWNPATRQFRILPKSIRTIEIDDDDFVKYGSDFVALGFDVKTKDYKVLLITNYYYSINNRGAPKILCRVQVYSLSTDSWRLINSPFVLPVQNHGLYMNGCCFFIDVYNHESKRTNNRYIKSFDFTKEIFTTIQLPDHDDDRRQRLYLRCLGGGGGEKMALFTTLRKTPSGEYQDHYYYDDGYEDCDIWVLNEHGCCAMSKESWTKLHSFQIKNCIDGKLIGLSNNGKFAFLEATEASCTRRIQLYNLVTKQVKLDIPFSVSRSKVYVYKPSLVSINSGNGAAAAPGGDEVIGTGAV